MMRLLFALFFILSSSQIAGAQNALHKFVSPAKDFSILLPADLKRDADSTHKFEATFEGHRYAVGSCKIFKDNGFDRSFDIFKKGIEEEGLTLKACVDKRGAGWKGKLCSFADSQQQMTILFARADATDIAYMVSLELPSSDARSIAVINSFEVQPTKAAAEWTK